jgi:hypothetical protein
MICEPHDTGPRASTDDPGPGVLLLYTTEDVPTSVRVTDERRGADVSAERVRVVCMVVCSVLVVV